ncbi:hypothetical protein HDU87_001300 [Geranomyces variabilis]|uniref:Trehalase n=1 Tax=Geranomyces variabilis TaxID=109894 RepID=A0AAD5TND6_9FUNG|nr:hypothetical protein HDU87_001300 [Geranomyces variabilis]
MVRFLAAFALLLGAATASAQATHTCNSPLYCPGPILDAVQRAAIFNDSKTFVDKPTTKPLADVLAAFNALPKPPSNADIQSFVNANFGLEGSEIEPITPRDWIESPKFLGNISDVNMRAWASTVHGYWKLLTRDFKKNSTACDGCVGSLLPANHTFVVPGGRFRELYYWDSYFVMLGLVRSEMYQTMEDMISNFMDYVKEYGFMPNGARIYYLNRSQPPLLTQMVSLYVATTQNTTRLAEWLPLLEQEHNFWETNRTVTVSKNGTSYALNRYSVTNAAPRPESYLEDAQTVEGANLNATAAADLYANLATGAETGWDFSSRWIENPINATTAQQDNLRRLVTRDVIPIDLNSILFANEVSLAALSQQAGDAAASQKYKTRASARQLAIWSVMYDDASGEFRDWDDVDKRYGEWSAASFWPTWAGVADTDPRGAGGNGSSAADTCQKLMGTFKILDMLTQQPGGLATTLYNTGLQWDYPNSWPPQTFIALSALQRASTNCANPTLPLADYASKIATTFIEQAFCSWRQTGGALPNLPPLADANGDSGHMAEKFNVTMLGAAGGGGEYTVQTGFGWTNGVVLSVLATVGKSIAMPDCSAPGTMGNPTTPATGATPATGSSAKSAAFGRRPGLPIWLTAAKALFAMF